MWPWTIKFLWSPFLELFTHEEVFRSSSHAARQRPAVRPCGKALPCQRFFAVTVALRRGCLQRRHAGIAADGVYMSELSTSDRAKYIGWQGAFYNLAKLVARAVWSGSRGG